MPVKKANYIPLWIGLFLTFGVLQFSWGQATLVNPKLNQYESIKLRTLAVELRVEDSVYVAKLENRGKTEKIETYRSGIETYNKYLKSSINAVWNMCPVEYKTPAEMNYLRHHADIGTYALLTEDIQKIPCSPCAFYEANALIMRFPEEKEEIVFSILPSRKKNTRGDYVFAVARLQQKVEDYIDKSKNGNQSLATQKLRLDAKLQHKTLLLDEGLLAKNATEEHIKEEYPYPFRIVTTKEADDALISQAPGVMVVKLIRNAECVCKGGSDYVALQHLLVDTENGHFLVAEVPPAPKEIITLKELRIYAEDLGVPEKDGTSRF